MNNLLGIARAIRRHSIDGIYHAGSGHPGGSLSVADVLAVLYFEEMRVDPSNPAWVERDRLVLSKGHACPALYAALALKGFYSVSELRGLRNVGHYLEGHPDVRIPGVDAPSGSLGIGLSQGLGMALGARHAKMDFRTYVILGDGDMQEGNTWEALMAAGHHKVANLVAILDFNGLQGEDTVAQQMNYDPVAEKIRAFGWNVLEIDGHDLRQIREALDAARKKSDRPSFIVARTVKGKGVSWMEGVQKWHGSSTLSSEERARALHELGA